MPLEICCVPFSSVDPNLVIVVSICSLISPHVISNPRHHWVQMRAGPRLILHVLIIGYIYKASLTRQPLMSLTTKRNSRTVQILKFERPTLTKSLNTASRPCRAYYILFMFLSSKKILCLFLHKNQWLGCTSTWTIYYFIIYFQFF